MKKNKGILKIILSIMLVLVIAVLAVFLVKKFIIDANNEANITDIPTVEHNLNELKFDKYTSVENGVIINKSEKIKEEKVIDEFTISDYELTYEDGTRLIGNVKNNSTEDKTEGTDVIIKFLDENGVEIASIIGDRKSVV